MELLGIGAQMYKAAEQKLGAAAQAIVKGASEGGPDAGDMVDMMRAGDEGKIAAKIMKAGREMDGTLLDILA